MSYSSHLLKKTSRKTETTLSGVQMVQHTVTLRVEEQLKAYSPLLSLKTGCYFFKQGEVRGERLSRVPCPWPEPGALLGAADIQAARTAEGDHCLGASPGMHEAFRSRVSWARGSLPHLEGSEPVRRAELSGGFAQPQQHTEDKWHIRACP